MSEPPVQSQVHEYDGPAVQTCKRLKTSVFTVNYTKYGLTTGHIEFDDKDKPSMIVIARGWPSWAFSAQAGGFHLVKLILLDDTWRRYSTKVLGEGLVLDYNSLLEDNACELHAEVVVSDIDLPASALLWHRVDSVYLSRRSVRKGHGVPSAFHHVCVRLTHTQSGGVTDGEWLVNLYLRQPLRWYESFLPLSATQDLSCIVNTTLGHGLPCPPPIKLATTTPKVLQIRPGMFHGSGLFPFLNRRAYFVVPNIFSTTKWCRRHFSSEETLGALDISEDHLLSLASHERAELCHDTTFLPSKSVVQLLRSLWQTLDRSPATLTLPSTPLNVQADCSSQPHGFPVQTSTYHLPSVCPLIGDKATFDMLAHQTRLQKTAKADDATVPVQLWNARLCPALTVRQSCAAGTLRRWFHRVWCRRLFSEFQHWFFQEHGHSILYRRMGFSAKRDLIAGMDCLSRCWDSDWWEWRRGSRPHFWRWPRPYLSAIRDGLPVWLTGTPTPWRVPQRKEQDPRLHDGMRAKIAAVRAKGYIVPGTVVSLTSFFAVPKGDTDIRMVYDGTKSGFNHMCWAPWFMLPTVDQHIRATVPGSFMGDLDIGEMFLNFVLHASVRKYCGVDLTTLFPSEALPNHVLWEVWARCGMGFTFSPYQAVRGVLWAEEFILGDRYNFRNPFRFYIVQLNLPGMPGYDPSLPWVCKLRADGLLASELLIYVDDLRVIACSNMECWIACSWVASHINYLGLQDAPRKRREPSQEAGPWAGSVVHTTHGAVTVLISLERWLKVQSIIQWIQDQALLPDGIEHKQLERFRGILVYVSRTYPAMVPYLKGIHLTLDSWRPWRRSDGWKMTSTEMRAYHIEKGWDDIDPPSPHSLDKPPQRVKPVPRLTSDLVALQQLTSSATPPKRLARPTSSTVALYGFADASGRGFGSTLFVSGKVHFRHGQWSAAYDDHTSNFRELDNLVLAIEEAHRDKLLLNAELFMFTDNSPAESAFYKGTSSVPHLFDLVLRLRVLQMSGSLHLHVVHCAGTRMKAEGTDGLSRGNLTEGVMRGGNILTFLPLHHNILERQPAVRQWVESWWQGRVLHWITPDQWFTEGQSLNHCVWTPPPAAADAAIECLAKAKHKRPENLHMVLIPRLMTSRWRKLLGKVCDAVITVPVGTEFWGHSQHEPFLLGLSFPLIRHRPWRLRGTQFVERVVSHLRSVPPATPEWGRFILRQFCAQAGQLDELSEGLVWDMLCGNSSPGIPSCGTRG